MKESGAPIKKQSRVVVILPCFNEGQALNYTIDALAEVQQKLAPSVQLDILFVNDGSTDYTQTVIEAACASQKNMYYLSLAYNVGQQVALRAGFQAAANYDATIMMDADMQHPPALIPKMIEHWQNGAMLVQTIRDDSARDKGLFSYTASRMYAWFINRLSGIRLEYGAADFRIIDKKIIELINHSTERDLYTRAYFAALPVESITLPYKPNKRIAGTSKYSLRKLFNIAFKSVTQFSTQPLRLGVHIGIIIAIAAIIYGGVLVNSYLIGQHGVVSNWASLAVNLLFGFGVVFILEGVVGAYLGHLISLQRKRPEFVIASEKLPPRASSRDIT